MKTKRFVSTLLALLLICSLPVSAFAATVPDNLLGTEVDVKEGDWMESNEGTVTTNNGNIHSNSNTVKTNNGHVQENHHTVEENNGTIHLNYDTVNSNDGTVEINKGTVDTNSSTGTVTTNYVTVTTNNGTVTTNNGTVDTNSSTGTVTTNGTLPESETEDLDANAIVQNNYGTVTTNNGVVKANGTSANKDNAVVGTNNGFVEANNGTITTNENAVMVNYGAVNTNNGFVEHNNLTVSTNNGVVGKNYGTVVTNSVTGTVNNKGQGTVTTNYGTVKEADNSFHYGVQVEGEDNSDPVQKTKGVALDLAALFTKAGYVLTGYSYAYTMGEDGVEKASSPTTVSDTSYTADCPNVLTLIWQAIVNPGSGENTAAAGETAAAADDGAGYFGPGSRISINGRQYLLVAVVEDVYCLASIDSFEAEQLSDLPALLSSLLTEEQLSHVTGDPELLDEALTARFFGGEGSHIVFPCDKGLIFS